MFIGNSDAFGGNSQVLTQWGPNDQIIRHTYRGFTGVTPATTVSRSIGAKLDDWVSARDYGAIGNGTADDTAALQNAITDRYATAVANGHSPLSAFVTIWIPAGVYRITQSLKLYPFVRLVGEGMDRTKIVLDNDMVMCVAQTVDGAGNTDANIGTDLATLPTGIDISGIWFDQPSDIGDAIRLQRCNRIRLDGVRLTGPRPPSTDVQLDAAGIRLDSFGTAILTEQISISGCEISGMGHAIYSMDPIEEVRITSCYIHSSWNGVVMGSAGSLSGGPKRVKVMTSSFADLDGNGISYDGANLGIISMGNSFNRVGLQFSSNPVYWGPNSRGCASMGDQFEGSVVDDIADLNPAMNLILDPQMASLTSQIPMQIGPVTLLDSDTDAPTIITYDTAEFNTITLDYSMTRGASKRMGKIRILTDGTNAVVQDDATTLGADLGVTFSYSIATGFVTLTYTTTATGEDAVMNYTEIKSFT